MKKLLITGLALAMLLSSAQVGTHADAPRRSGISAAFGFKQEASKTGEVSSVINEGGEYEDSVFEPAEATHINYDQLMISFYEPDETVLKPTGENLLDPLIRIARRLASYPVKLNKKLAPQLRDMKDATYIAKKLEEMRETGFYPYERIAQFIETLAKMENIKNIPKSYILEDCRDYMANLTREAYKGFYSGRSFMYEGYRSNHKARGFFLLYKSLVVAKARGEYTFKHLAMYTYRLGWLLTR